MGFEAFADVRNAGPGSVKNITPKREKTRSCVGWKRCVAASASMKFTPAPRLRATASIGAEMSTPVTLPDRPTALESA